MLNKELIALLEKLPKRAKIEFGNVNYYKDFKNRENFIHLFGDELQDTPDKQKAGKHTIVIWCEE